MKLVKSGVVYVETSSVFSVYDEDKIYYPIFVGYASTIHKNMGDNLPHYYLSIWSIHGPRLWVCCTFLSKVSRQDSAVNESENQ